MKTIFASIVALMSLSAIATAGEYYQLSTYQLKGADKAASFDKMMAAAVPVLKGAGLSQVGVFKAKGGEKDGDPNWRYVLSAADSLDTFAESRLALAADSEFLETAREYLSYAKTDAALDRISVSTFEAFAGFPKLAAPAAEGAAGRFFEVREYQSYNEYKAYMKVKMFNEGELDIFKDVGLKSVFFGSALAGPDLPNLTYMLAYDSEEAKKTAWDAFRGAPAWKALSGEEQYKDTVSKIVAKFLVALPYSTIK